MSKEITEEIERRNNVALWAYAYEIQFDSLVDDHHFDRVCREVQPQLKTGDAALDAFFAEEFDPCTGSWIYKHPHLSQIEKNYVAIKAGRVAP